MLILPLHLSHTPNALETAWMDLFKQMKFVTMESAMITLGASQIVLDKYQDMYVQLVLQQLQAFVLLFVVIT